MSDGKGTRAGFRAAAILIYAFMYVPIAVLVVFSFQESRVLSWPIDAWSLRWYAALLDDHQLLQSIANSFKVATACVVVTTVVGVPLALALRQLGRGVALILERTILMPLIVPPLITGLAFLLIFNRSGLKLSLLTIIIGQSIVWMPLVVTQVYARLQSLDEEIEQASMDLGANRLQTFFLVTLPAIRTSVIGSALLVFTLSFDELPVTFFLTGSENTLPMHIWSMLRIGITPEINAIASLTVLASILLILAGTRLLLKNDKAK
ncbi:ABC transporter permease [Amorphus orientalis]|uniref:Spermidine/putrescine transport system permease protein n=1 Tax=Amorphus orientalis TaxID=649198 RepID=A0AAE3VTQ2_9HYPH|nr:ABC transporter permease [Amorphus orientalis]MDQ0317436.1 spermidine/putrescine transport system permease protein [Amorphus orientalis]